MIPSFALSHRGIVMGPLQRSIPQIVTPECVEHHRFPECGTPIYTGNRGARGIAESAVPLPIGKPCPIAYRSGVATDDRTTSAECGKPMSLSEYCAARDNPPWRAFYSPCQFADTVPMPDTSACAAPF